jgi:hypothetical protein
MADLQIPETLARQIQEEATAEGIAVAALLENALRERRRRLQRAKLDAELAAWRAQLPEARARYRGEYVAVHEGSVVDHDPDLAALHRRIRARYGRIAVLLTPADGRPPLRIRRPKLAQP